MTQTPDRDPQSPWTAEASMDSHDRKPQGVSALTIVGILTFVMLILGGFLIAGIYFVAVWSAEAHTDVELPVRESPFAADRAAVANSITALRDPPHPDTEELLKWLDRTRANGALTPDRELFMAAVLNGPYGSDLTIINRIELRTSLQAELPELSLYENIEPLRIGPGDTPDTRRLFLVSYDEANLPELIVLHLAETSQGWRLYDWSEIGLGRRESDLYAIYFKTSDGTHIGYDDAMDFVSDAYEQSASGDVDSAIRSLERAQNLRVPAELQEEVWLYIAYAYQYLDHWEEAKRLMLRIKNRDRLSAVWASLGTSYLETGEHDKALETVAAIERLLNRHPAADFVAGQAFKAQERNAEAAARYLDALELCPDDSSIFHLLLSVIDAEQARETVAVAAKSKHADRWFVDIDSWIGDDDVWQALAEEIKQLPDPPSGLLEYYAAEELRRRGELDQAASRFASVATNAEAPDSLRQTAHRSWIDVRLQGENPAQLLSEAEDRDAILVELTDTLLDEYLYLPRGPATLEKLGEAIDPAVESSPFAAAVKGLAAYHNQQWSTAAKWLAQFVDAEPTPAEDPEAYSRDEAIPRFLVDALLQEDRIEEAVQQVDDGSTAFNGLVDYLINRGDKKQFADLATTFDEPDSAAERVAASIAGASLAAIARDAEACNQAWHRAHQSLGDSEQLYFARTQVVDRWTHAILALDRLDLFSSSLPKLANDEPTLATNLLSAAARIAAQQMDEPAMEAINSIAEAAELKESCRFELNDMRAQFAEQKHLWSLAAQFREQAIGSLDSDNDYLLAEQRTQRVSDLLRAERLREARRLVDELPEDEPVLEILLSLAQREPQRVDEQVQQLQEWDRGAWMYGIAARHWLFAHPLPRSELINRWHPSVWHLPAHWSALLVLDAPPQWSAAEIEAIVEPLFGSDIQFQTRRPPNSSSNERLWVLTREGEFQLAITAGIGHWQATGFARPDLVDQLSTSKYYLGIDLIYSRGPHVESSYELLAALANPNTTVVHDATRDLTWVRNDAAWAERLAWDARIPVDLETIPEATLVTVTDERASSDARGTEANSAPALKTPPTPEQLAGWLDKARPVIARVAVHSGYAEERLAGQLARSEESPTAFELELTESSALFPLLRKGIKLAVTADELIDPAPQQSAPAAATSTQSAADKSAERSPD